jgi:hypothetical protein
MIGKACRGLLGCMFQDTETSEDDLMAPALDRAQ